MSIPSNPDRELEHRIASRLLDVLIRAGLILAMTLLCYRVFAPFLPLMIWAVILAVMIYPLHQSIARRIGGRQGLAASLLVVTGLVLIAGPATVLMSSLGDGVHQFVNDVRNNTLVIPAPRASIAEWPVIGERLYAAWSMAHSDLPALVSSMQPKIGDLTKSALAFVAGIGISLMQFLAAFVIAGIIMAFGASGARSCRAISNRIVGVERGAKMAELSTSTIRAVALGVIGIAFIQATLVGGALLIAGVPWAGVLAVVALVLGIAQVPAAVVILPAIVYLWVGGDYSTAQSIGYTILLVLSGLADNILKPLLLGRGVEAPMPVVLLGALGGMATNGILGMFLGATLLALGYQLFMSWVAHDPDIAASTEKSDPTSPC
ncbi:MAG: AI-2E family transporter [Spongiibacteraceae bacterium]